MNSQISVLDKKVKLIVYIPCFGYERFVKKAIKSLKNQSFKKYICKVYVLKNDEKPWFFQWCLLIFAKSMF